ncbi:S8 family serine peptidase, partial [Amnibacterium sp.]|uniref:S8 family serine peptidase n=1 Tax=Amnibacterium sp. TaxID=1872496 RepID=UPI00261A621A
PTAAALDATLPAGLHVTAVTPLAAGLAGISVRGPLDPAGAAAVGNDLAEAVHVAAASPAFRTRIAGAAAPVTATDPFFGRQWDLWDAASLNRAGGFGVDAARAWQRTRGTASVVVAVLDTGITAHPDLASAHLVPGFDFVTGGDGVVTGDRDGWDDDPADPGDACSTDSPATPSSWHGTFVTGEIAAGRNDRGVAGEAPGVSIEPVRVIGGCGGSESDLLAGIEWASGGTVPGAPANAHPAQVLSLSIGGAAPDGCDPALQQAVTDAWQRGSTIVAAAGNDDAPMAGTAPADCDHVVSVAASTRYGNRSPFSNFGTAGRRPTIAAPGGSAAGWIWGDTWTSSGSIRAAGNQPALAEYAGTSMAVPRVSAAVALLLSVQSGLAPDAVAARLVATATPFPARSTCTVARCGAGVVNAGDLVGAVKRFVHATRATITGTARAGSVLMAHAGVFRAGATGLTYRWYRDGAALAATGTRYRLRAADRGASLTVHVTATRNGYRTAVVVSGARRIAR